MTEAEALVFLSVEDDQDVEDAYLQRIFEFKQYFSSKPVVLSTFQSRLNKLDKISEAANLFGLDGHTNFNDKIELIENPSFSSDILNSFQQYQHFLTKVRFAIYQSQSTQELKSKVLTLMGMSMEYYSHWPYISEFENTVILSKEPDPMELLSDIKYAKEEGILTFTDLAKDLTKRFSLLKLESTRLNKLNTLGQEWKKR